MEPSGPQRYDLRPLRSRAPRLLGQASDTKHTTDDSTERQVSETQEASKKTQEKGNPYSLFDTKLKHSIVLPTVTETTDNNCFPFDQSPVRQGVRNRIADLEGDIDNLYSFYCGNNQPVIPPLASSSPNNQTESRVPHEFDNFLLVHQSTQLADSYSDLTNTDFDNSLNMAAPEHGEHQVPQNQINPMTMLQSSMAMAFKPSSFNGLHLGAKWLRNFNRYVELTGLDNQTTANLFGLCMTGPAQTWFNSLTEEQRGDYGRIEEIFREKYVVAAPSMVQRQLATLSMQQLPTQTVEEFIMDAREKLLEHGYDQNLQLTLLLNGLLPEIKTIIMQFLPFNDIEAFITRAKYAEQAVKSSRGVLVNNIMPTANVGGYDGDTTERVLKTAVEKMVNIMEKKLGELNINTESNENSIRPRNKNRVRFADDSNVVRRCFQCNSKFHVQRDCPARRRSGEFGRRQFQSSSFRGRSVSPRGRFNSPNNRYSSYSRKPDHRDGDFEFSRRSDRVPRPGSPNRYSQGNSPRQWYRSTSDHERWPSTTAGRGLRGRGLNYEQKN